MTECSSLWIIVGGRPLCLRNPETYLATSQDLSMRAPDFKWFLLALVLVPNSVQKFQVDNGNNHNRNQSGILWWSRSIPPYVLWLYVPMSWFFHVLMQNFDSRLVSAIGSMFSILHWWVQSTKKWKVSETGRWFGTFFIFHNIWDNPSIIYGVYG